MTNGPEAFAVATDAVIARLIADARRRLVVVAPALSVEVANAVAERCRVLPPEQVALIVDSDPEVYRLGLGDIEGLKVVSDAAGAAGIALRRQPGVRIGVVISDDETLVYVPTPRAIEAGPNTDGGANAIRLSVPVQAVARDLGLDGMDPTVGRTELAEGELKRIHDDVKANPPQRFDIARQLRVFESLIQFVEFTVTGTKVADATVRVPSWLLVAAGAATQRRLKAAFHLVAEDHQLPAGAFDRRRQDIAKKYLHVLPGYGSVILVREREAFEKEANALGADVEAYADSIEDALQRAMDRNRGELADALTPALVMRPPDDWRGEYGGRLTHDETRQRVDDELRSVFGPASRLVRRMKVTWLFKGVTYDLLTDPAFCRAAAKALPEVEQRFHTEVDAAPAVSRIAG
jgi:hypothetical protein